MTSAVNRAGGNYPPRPITSNERKLAQVDQIVGQAKHTYHQALGSIREGQKARSGTLPEEKGFFKSCWDKLTSIF
jgi:hypothetical protein